MGKHVRLTRLLLAIGAVASMGASYPTPNFVVHAPSEEVVMQLGQAAHIARPQLADKWLGEERPRRSSRCPIHVKVGQIGAGGATTFSFDRGEVFGWKMQIQGSLERILDSVLPHEISHTIFACHFRRPLPRWADEGAATLVEHHSERLIQRDRALTVMRTAERIPLRSLMSMKEYPTNMQDVLTLYAEGYSLADYLVQQGGKKRYLEFLQCAHQENWDHAIKRYYGAESIERLEQLWSGWVIAGSPELRLPEGTELADTSRRPDIVVRSQTPERLESKTSLQAPAPGRSLTVSDSNGPSPAAAAALERAGWQPVPERRPTTQVPAQFAVEHSTSDSSLPDVRGRQRDRLAFPILRVSREQARR